MEKSISNSRIKVEPMVSVCMLTYKHEKYIAEAIDGVLMQQANFDIELIITNDASPDKTDEIVKNYINTHHRGNWIEYFAHEINMGFLPNFIFTLQQCKGKYITFCSGDDYWVDSLKLQKQVDFLETNLDYGLIYTNFEIDSNGKIFKSELSKSKQPPSGVIFKELLLGKFYVFPHTVCVRRDLYMEWADIILKEAVNRKWKMEDFPLWLEGSLKTKFAYMPDVTSHYRVLSHSASHNPDKTWMLEFMKSVFEVKRFFVKRENLDRNIKDEIEHQYYLMLLIFYISMGNKKQAIEAYEFLKINNKYPATLRMRMYYWAAKYNGVWILIQVMKKARITKLMYYFYSWTNRV